MAIFYFTVIVLIHFNFVIYFRANRLIADKYQDGKRTTKETKKNDTKINLL
jgi:hypothetical protein